MTALYVESGGGTPNTGSYRGAWVASTAFALGDRVVPSATTNAYVYECTTAGTSSATEPTWGTTTGGTTTDGSAVWTCRLPSTRANANVSISKFLYNSSGYNNATDTVYISASHNEAYSGALLINPGGVSPAPLFICADISVNPPTTLATGAVIGASTGYTIQARDGTGFWYGTTFRAGQGSGSSFSLSQQASSNGTLRFEKCVFDVATTGATASVTVDRSVQAEWYDCDVKFANVGQKLIVGGHFHWNGGSVLSGSSAITTLVQPNIDCHALIENVDLSNIATSATLVSANVASATDVVFRNCKLPAGWTGTIAQPKFPRCRASMYNCDSGSTNYRMLIADYAGKIFSETTVVKASGASDGTTQFSWKMVADATLADYPFAALHADEIVVWNETVGSAITVTIDVLTDGVTLTDADAWIEYSYAGNSGSPLGVRGTTRLANFIAGTPSNLATSAASWTATVLTSPVAQKISATFTPQKKGPILVALVIAKPGVTVYADPLLAVA